MLSTNNDMVSSPAKPLPPRKKTTRPHSARVRRVATREIKRVFRRATVSLRGLPDFVIIGAQKCGTTSLHNYLIEHPRIAAGFPKRSEEHTSELQSPCNLVCRLLLEKKEMRE